MLNASELFEKASAMGQVGVIEHSQRDFLQYQLDDGPILIESTAPNFARVMTKFTFDAQLRITEALVKIVSRPGATELINNDIFPDSKRRNVRVTRLRPGSGYPERILVSPS